MYLYIETIGDVLSLVLVWFLCYLGCLLLYWDTMKNEWVAKSEHLETLGEKTLTRIYIVLPLFVWPWYIYSHLLEFICGVDDDQ